MIIMPLTTSNHRAYDILIMDKKQWKGTYKSS